MKQACTILLMFLSFGLYAQNWKTVSDKDTVYFMAGKHGIGYTHSLSTDSNVVKAIWIIWSQQIAGDSLFHFFNCVRSTDSFYSCIDSVAPSWLGSYFLRKPSGIEYYFNSYGDTIVVRTGAQVGDSWLLATATDGTEYIGTVVSAGLQNVDTTLDSVKTISIQAYQNNLPVTDWYNSLELRFSKNHGWVEALDLYRFPNKLNNWEEYGAVIDSTQHFRLPVRFKLADRGHIDFAWKYAVGNEWIEHLEGWASPGYDSYVNQKVTHDSVISSVFLPNSAIVAFKTDVFTLTWHFQQGPPYSYWYHTDSINTYFHTDTIANVASLHIGNYVYPELIINRQVTPDFNTRYFTDTFCNGRYIIRSHSIDDQMVNFGPSCWELLPNVSGYHHGDSSYLCGFGRIYSHWEWGETSTEFWGSDYFSYLKLGDCTWGDYINVLTLGVGHAIATHEFSIYPNPANEVVHVRTMCSLGRATTRLTDLTGRLMTSQYMTDSDTEVSTQNLPDGIYILTIQTENAIANYKVLIQH